MKIHYVVEYFLIKGWSINRGELGGLDTIRKYSESDLEAAILFINKYKIVNKSDAEDNKIYFLYKPRIYKMSLRLDMRDAKVFHVSNMDNWVEVTGDVCEVKVEYFNLKTKLMDYSAFSCKTIKEAWSYCSKLKDSKTRILSDWKLYSKSVYQLN